MCPVEKREEEIQSIEATGKTLEEAKAAALSALGASAEEVAFEILAEPRRLLGFITGEYRVRATRRPSAEDTQPAAKAEAPGPEIGREENGSAMSLSSQEDVGELRPKPITDVAADSGNAMQQVIAQRAIDFLQEATRLMGLTTDVVVVAQEPGEITIDIRGRNLGPVIGRHGATLDALQFLAAIVANSGFTPGARILVDCEKYRERRRRMLEELAREQAQKAKETKQEVVIPDLKPYERRIIHLALRDDPDVVTYSEGEGEERCLIISPRNA